MSTIQPCSLEPLLTWPSLPLPLLPDDAKCRYYKIESGNTAPAGAVYSAANVKKRMLEHAARDKTRKRQERLAAHLKPARVLGDVRTGARLMREIGVYDPELPAKSWISAMQRMGGIAFGTADGPSIECMLINGHDAQSGMGVVYAGTYVVALNSQHEEPLLVTADHCYKQLMVAGTSAPATSQPTSTEASTSMPTLLAARPDHARSAQSPSSSTTYPPSPTTSCRTGLYRPQRWQGLTRLA